MNSFTIRAALRRAYPAPEYAILFEVTDATGARHTRSADAVTMSLWPSMGLGVIGFEIKVSRGDWLREKKDPSKAEAIARYCDYWYIVTPAGLVKVDELPEAWGLKEVDENGQIKTVKQAVKTESVPLDRLFVASLLRNAHKVNDDDVETIVRDRVQIQVDAEIQRIAREKQLYGNFAEKLQIAVESARKDGDWLDQGEIIDAVLTVARSGVGRSYGGVLALERQLREAADRIATITGLMAVPKKKGRA